MSTFICLPGRYLVLSSTQDADGISKKIIDNEEKKRLISFLEKNKSNDHSIIVRTASVGTSMNDIEREYR